MSLKEDFDRDGFAVWRGQIRNVDPWVEAWASFNADVVSKREVRWNPGEVVGPFPEIMDDLPRFLTPTAAELLGVAAARVYNYRFMVKDRLAPGGTFLHNDLAYHVGSQNKLSAFVALSSVIPENGGLWLWPKTHKFGYLGDAGEINPKILGGAFTPVSPVLAPGDVLYMNSATWHQSHANSIGLPRVLADIIYADANDPAQYLPRDEIFVRSRVSRIKALEAELAALKAKA